MEPDFTETRQHSYKQPKHFLTSVISEPIEEHVKVNNEETEITFLATAQIRLRTGGQTTSLLRALCDTGSQLNMITESCVKAFGLIPFRSKTTIASFNSSNVTQYSQKVNSVLLSRFDELDLMLITLVVVPDLLLNVSLSAPTHLPIPKQIKGRLADPSYQTSGTISVLLGAGVWARAAQPEYRNVGQGVLAQSMSFGWILMGSINSASNDQTNLTATTGNLRLDELFERFCSLDELPVLSREDRRTPEQQICEEYFMQKHSRDENGRYIVGIPVKNEISSLGSSREIAMQRFKQLERRLERDIELKEKYLTTINDYKARGHMKLADRAPTSITYYVPHHCVQKKFRVVFDGSCRTSSGKSFNDMQNIGERLQDDLPNLLTRFRCNKIAVTADIKQMYRQINIRPDQWDLQRILWRDNQSDTIQEYWLTTVTFGMASAPHCAIRAMIQCARDNKIAFPIGARVVEEDFYVDDCLTGAASVDEAEQLCKELMQVLNGGGFELSKWHSNHNFLLEKKMIFADDVTKDVDLLTDTTILGLRWLPSTDELAFRVKPTMLNTTVITKRNILKCIAQLYDPTGCLGPTIVLAKILLQHLWKEKISWDQPVSEELSSQWMKFQRQLSALETIRIPRWLFLAPDVKFEIHGFADASQAAYGAAIYWRVIQTDGASCVNLVMSKSRVAPAKVMSIPRLELCAAELLSKLAIRTARMCHWSPERQIMWSDSTIVLYWIKKPLGELKTFVSNRVKCITDNTINCEWRHVPTDQNPADLLSRGISPSELPTNQLWWHGPTWLKENETTWPKAPTKITDDMKKHISENTRAEQRLQLVNVITIRKNDVPFIDIAPSFNRLMRVSALILRVMSNWMPIGRRMGPRRDGNLSTTEIEKAIEFWIKNEQGEFYQTEIRSLKEEGSVRRNSDLLALSPRTDEKGIMRVGGRLERALIPYTQKHPIILSSKGNLSKLIIRDAHFATNHGGIQQMMCYIRQKYWIIGLRRAIRAYNIKCIACIRMRHTTSSQLMADLPSDRVRPSKAFENTGVDYAGPFQIRARSGRCKIIEKGYVAVFVCMSTKAVHLEVVPDLTTAAFIRAFQRFTSTRGRCKRVWSDNAKNFVGAEKELFRQLGTWPANETVDQLSTAGTEWKFITPAAPHQGGLWEAAVRSMKYHLKRVMGQQQLTYEMFDTLVKQIAGCLNSRPLTALSDDPDDLQILTPAHFLVGESILQPPGPFFPSANRSRLQTWALVQSMVQGFWKIWSNNYLNQLQQRPKWANQSENIKVGDLVLLKSETILPTLWPRGRVVEVYPGADGLVRNVKIQTGNTTLARAIQKIILLPYTEDN